MERTGTAFIWGVAGLSGVLENSVETETATLAAVSIFQDLDFSREADSEDLADANGDTRGRAYFNKRQTARVTVVPAALGTDTGTLSVARTNADLLLPTPGSKVSSLADSDVTKIDGTYIVNRASFSRTNRNIMAIELELEKFDDHDITIAVS